MQMEFTQSHLTNFSIQNSAIPGLEYFVNTSGSFWSHNTRDNYLFESDSQREPQDIYDSKNLGSHSYSTDGSYIDSIIIKQQPLSYSSLQSFSQKSSWNDITLLNNDKSWNAVKLTSRNLFNNLVNKFNLHRQFDLPVSKLEENKENLKETASVHNKSKISKIGVNKRRSVKQKSGLFLIKKMAMSPSKKLTQKTTRHNLQENDCSAASVDTTSTLSDLKSDNEEEVPQSKYIKKEKHLEFSCSFCSERMATKNSLITHMKSHLQPFCIECLTVFKTRDQLKNHMKDFHSNYKILVTSKYGRRRHVLQNLANPQSKVKQTPNK